MAIDLSGLWHRALAPETGFRRLAGASPSLLPSLGCLLVLRVPVAFLELLLTFWSVCRMYRLVAGMEGPLWGLLGQCLPPEVSLEDLRSLLMALPPAPSLARALPWLLLAAPLYVLSLWLHDAVWDHGCLWLVGGLKPGRGFRTTLLAESEALQVGVFGAILAPLTGLPGVGWVLALPIGILGAYFWVLRGVALAAYHGCPTWKGVVATVIHAALAALFLLGSLLVFFVLLAQLLA